MKIIFQKSHIYKKSQLKQTDRHHQTTTAQHPRGTVQKHKKEPERIIITERHQTNGWMVWTDIFISWMTECLWTFLSSWFCGDTIQWVMKPFSFLSDREEADVYNEWHMDYKYDHDRWIPSLFALFNWWSYYGLSVGFLKGSWVHILYTFYLFSIHNRFSFDGLSMGGKFWSVLYLTSLLINES